jgi:GR25 family glycosyltransferase involved in LPS biosynthesis
MIPAPVSRHAVHSRPDPRVLSTEQPRVGEESPGTQLDDEPVFHACPPDPSCPYCNGSVDPAQALDWSFLDGVYCISLKSREDRAIDVAAQFHKVGLCRQVQYYRPLRFPGRGYIGSWESHRAVAEHAGARGYQTTLILEDDVQFVRRLTPRSMRAIARAIKRLPPEWMIFYLGHWPLWAYFVRPNVLRTSSGCAHAYIVSPRLLQWLHEHPWGTPGIAKRRMIGKALDSAYAMLPATYALFPMIATQSISRSDNFAVSRKKNTKLKHIITHSRHREWLLSRLMRPFEVIVVVLSPVFHIAALVQRLRERTRLWLVRPLSGLK